jgi:hypothetical protein
MASYDEYYDGFATNVSTMSDNLFSIAQAVSTGEHADKELDGFPGSIQITTNYLLNLVSRPDLLMGYVKRVYVHRRSFDNGDGDAIIDDEEYFYGDVPFARPYAPKFKRLWQRHMDEDEKARALRFFRTFNEIVEDWIAAGAAELFAAKDRAFDRSVLERIDASLTALDDVPDEEQAGSLELKRHYELLARIRAEFIAYRQEHPTVVALGQPTKKPLKKKTVQRANATEVQSVTVSKHGDRYEVDAVDVRVEKQKDGGERVRALKVKTEVDAPKGGDAKETKPKETKPKGTKPKGTKTGEATKAATKKEPAEAKETKSKSGEATKPATKKKPAEAKEVNT